MYRSNGKKKNSTLVNRDEIWSKKTAVEEVEGNEENRCISSTISQPLVLWNTFHTLLYIIDAHFSPIMDRTWYLFGGAVKLRNNFKAFFSFFSHFFPPPPPIFWRKWKKARNCAIPRIRRREERNRQTPSRWRDKTMLSRNSIHIHVYLLLVSTKYTKRSRVKGTNFLHRWKGRDTNVKPVNSQQLETAKIQLQNGNH